MQLSELNDALAVLDDWTALLWDYSSSHSRLCLALRPPGERPWKYLVLLGCTDLRMPTMWRVASMGVVATDAGFLLSDATARIEFTYEYQLVDTYEP